MKSASMFRSLRRRNFRLFLGGQLVSNLGTWMQNVALAWLVLQVTHSPFDVGAVSAVQFVPALLFGAYGGVVADRFPKRNLLVLTQSGLALSAATLATLDLTGTALCGRSTASLSSRARSGPSTCPPARPSCPRWWAWTT